MSCAVSEFQIRLATDADIPALESLIAASVRGLSRTYYSVGQIESALIHVFGVDSQLIEDGTYFVMQTQGQIAGCGGWSRRRTLYGGDQWKIAAEDSLLNPATEAARIRAFFVHPGQARKGIGQQLLVACEKAARDADFTRMELVATRPGEPFYSAAGYKAAEQIEISLPDGLQLPCRRMLKSLTD